MHEAIAISPVAPWAVCDRYSIQPTDHSGSGTGTWVYVASSPTMATGAPPIASAWSTKRGHPVPNATPESKPAKLLRAGDRVEPATLCLARLRALVTYPADGHPLRSQRARAACAFSRSRDPRIVRTRGDSLRADDLQGLLRSSG